MRFLLPAFTLGALLAAPLFAGDDGLTGHWKFHIYQGGRQSTFWLLHLQSKDGKLTATLDPLRGGPKGKIDEVKIVGDLLTMNVRATFVSGPKQQVISFVYEGKLPKVGAKKIYGSLFEDGLLIPVVLEATVAKTPFELERDTVVKTPTDPKAMMAILDVIKSAKENNVPAKDLQEWVNVSLKAAEMYGPRVRISHESRLLEALQDQKNYAAVAVETARKITKQIDPKMPLETQSQLLATIANVLRNGMQPDEAETIEQRIDKLEAQPYAEYAKTALNYKAEKYPGRKGKSKRAVLVELFTGAQCPPCVAHDMAFDGVEKTYGPGEVVLLQYHMNIPAPEPMSNEDSEMRLRYYIENQSKQVRASTPTSLFNGKPNAFGGGRKADAEEKYKEYVEAINPLLETPTPLTLTASAVRKGDKIEVQGKVQELDKPGEKVRLRFVLVEDWVRYRGGNGLQYHHRVVRALPGGPKGFSLKEKTSEHKASIDLDELRKNLNKYLSEEEYNDGPRPMRLRELSVVAFVQNDETTEVLQAVNVRVQKE